MFNRSRSVRISGGTFSVVHGSQHNNYYTKSPRDQRRFGPGEEWKEEIYSEYERTPRGNIKLIKSFSDTQVYPFDKAVSRLYGKNNTVRAKRVVYLASIVNGTQESPPFLSVKYTGRDAIKVIFSHLLDLIPDIDLNAMQVFKADILGFSQIKDPIFPQLRSFNDSDIPMVIFHDALIPVLQVIEYAQNSLEVNLFICTQAQRVFSNFVLSTDFRSYPSIPWNSSDYLWIRPETGDICLGPAGPPLPHPFASSNRRYLDPYTDAPPLPPNTYNNHRFFDYVVKNSTSEHVLQVLTDQATWTRLHPHEFVDNRQIDHIWSSVQFYRQPLARFSVTLWNFTFNSFRFDEKPLEIIKIDGRMRLTIMDHHYPGVSFWFWPGGNQQSRHEAWLSQAVYVFNVLGIPRDRWEGFTMLRDTRIELSLWPDNDDTCVPLDPRLEAPRYLFIRPPPRLPDTTPDLAFWLQASAGSLYYWSLDPNGDSVMPETQRIALGLPCLYQKIWPIDVHCWKAEVYDLVRQLQEAKGFDPATTDFARSMGYPILGILPRDDNRFESHVEGNEELKNVNEPPGWEPMQVDECFNFEATLDPQDSIMQSEHLEGSASMDVEMEDCMNRMTID
ncbi:hypothetical protein PQX77_001382 [Marasmius sp. AFHP31]|nr:hypothetical protein PQX77_001382 [Marasmius sp. AFHP31]